MSTQKYLNGLQSIQRILTEFEHVLEYDQHKEDFLSYYKPDYIFRGVSTYKHEQSESKKDLLRIRSGAAVRLSNSFEQYHYAQYIAYIKDLISSAKNKFPRNYGGKLSDLDILADLQHNGAATCLVDFSKNILISIWHACQDGTWYKSKKDTKDEPEEDFFAPNSILQKRIFPQNAKISNHDGLLYCYNITDELLIKKSLTIVTDQISKKDIGDLLMRTQKVSDIQAQTQYKFWMWTPSNINERISHQNSVFIFGLERFWVHKHGVKIIVIPNKEKDNILLVLKDIFDISAPSIYHDSNGYADSQGKLKKIIEPISEKGEEGYNYSRYLKGVKNLLKGNLNVANGFFQQCQENTGNPYFNADLLYSKALFYEKSEKPEFAFSLLEASFKQCEDGLTNYPISNNDMKELFYSKQIQICRKMLSVSYQIRTYNECKNICKKIIQITKNSSKYSLYESTNAYCKLVIIESQILYRLNTGNTDYSNVCNHVNQFIDSHNKENSERKCIAVFFKHLVNLIESKNDDLEKKYEEARVELKKEFNNIKHPSYNPWIFSDLKTLISEKTYDKKQHILLRYIGCIENFFDMNNNKYLTDNNIEVMSGLTSN